MRIIVSAAVLLALSLGFAGHGLASGQVMPPASRVTTHHPVVIPASLRDRALALAVERGDVPLVRRLLDLGANPLAGAPCALEHALYRKNYADEPVNRSRLPAQASVIVPLLARHIVQVHKTPLGAIAWSPLELAVRDAALAGSGTDDGHDPASDAMIEADAAARVRLLVAAGFKAADLSEVAAAAAIGVSDLELAGELLDQGMLRSAPGKVRPAAQARVLLSAVAWRRTDLLPRLLKMGFDPNLRSAPNPSAVDYAIRLGAADALAILLGRARRDTAPGESTHQPVAVDTLAQRHPLHNARPGA
jgi:hypothetical protein